MPIRKIDFTTSQIVRLVESHRCTVMPIGSLDKKPLVKVIGTQASNKVTWLLTEMEPVSGLLYGIIADTSPPRCERLKLGDLHNGSISILSIEDCRYPDEKTLRYFMRNSDWY